MSGRITKQELNPALAQEISQSAEGLVQLENEVTEHLAEKASKTEYGHVQIGDGINVTDGIISVAKMTASNVSTTGGSNVQSELDILKSDTDNKVLSVRDAIVSKGGTVTQMGDVPTAIELVEGVESIKTSSGSFDYTKGSNTLDYAMSHNVSINSTSDGYQTDDGGYIHFQISGYTVQKVIYDANGNLLSTTDIYTNGGAVSYLNAFYIDRILLKDNYSPYYAKIIDANGNIINIISKNLGSIYTCVLLDNQYYYISHGSLVTDVYASDGTLLASLSVSNDEFLAGLKGKCLGDGFAFFSTAYYYNYLYYNGSWNVRQKGNSTAGTIGYVLFNLANR